MADSPLDVYWRLPPITRNFITAIATISLASHLGFVSMNWFVFHHSYLWRIPPQVWRLATAFCLTGGGMSLIFDAYFAYMYISQLENDHPRFRKKEDLMWYLVFVSGVITILCSTIVAKVFVFTHFLPALILAMTYTVTQDLRGQQARFLFFDVPAQLVPFCMLLMNLLFPGGTATLALQLTGLLAAHLYDFLTRIYPEFGGGPNLIPTPALIARITPDTPRAPTGGFAAAPPAAGRAVKTGSGPLPDSWKSRGQGHRLG